MSLLHVGERQTGVHEWSIAWPIISVIRSLGRAGFSLNCRVWRSLASMQCLCHDSPAAGPCLRAPMIFATGGLLRRHQSGGVPGAGRDHDRRAQGDIVRAPRAVICMGARSNPEALTFGGGHSSIAVLSAS